MPVIPPRSLAAILFVPDGQDYYQCRLCFSCRKQAVGNEYTNLVEHLVRHHPSTYEDELRVVQQPKGGLGAFAKSDDFIRCVYGWLDWIITESRELSMRGKVKTQKYTHLKPIGVKALKKHVSAVEELVQTRVKHSLAGQRLGFLIDA
ncbi:uncharacterized protein IUM83_19243 [Phytophthora cinnamomi]|uniref:uncharacterized protein n=1 Tax=Phytophthora cinnamomi TaxID=4785 RepID=UPI003559963F|nr:hypothetical protein IUM83_19243 [Phytophthora cinnamomi]